MLVMFDPEHNGPTGNSGWQTNPAGFVRFDIIRLSDMRVPHRSNPERRDFGHVRTVPRGVARLIKACRAGRASHVAGLDETAPPPPVGRFGCKRRAGVGSARPKAPLRGRARDGCHQ
jgi:hypothetical protein